MTAFKRLLAKSSKNPGTPRGAEALAGHTANVLAAAEALLDETADAQLVAVGLSPETWRERFRRGVLIAAFCHDLGKANDQFQAMVRHQREERQAIRHEALSLLIVQETALREWFATALEDADTLNFLLWAAAGHHRKFPPAEPIPGTGVRLSLFLEVIRMTDDPAPRLLYIFEQKDQVMDAPLLLARVEAGDIKAQELVIGGSFAATATAAKLKELGAEVFPGVRKAAETIIAKLES